MHEFGANQSAVVTIHGGTPRERRRQIQEAFENDPEVLVLVATDAAGEGINLHRRAHLMVNYDLPWNPNRIEQRFGRFHRIGQREVCHLWNLVAYETREGEVWHRLLSKLRTQRDSLGGAVFDVLGQVYRDTPLRDLLIRAIRYGDDPANKAKLDQIVDSELDTDKLRALIEDRSLVHERLDAARVRNIRDEMERAQARRLQPHYIGSFFLRAFEQFGGSVHRREPFRYEIRHVPGLIRHRDRVVGAGKAMRLADSKWWWAPGHRSSGPSKLACGILCFLSQKQGSFCYKSPVAIDVQTIDSKVKSRIYGNGRGWVFSPSQFLDLGNRSAVGVALHRLEKSGTIRRLTRGLYDYPKQHATFGLLAPSPDAVAKALAGKHAVRLQPSGAYAANLLGLSDQVPAKVVFLTDGAARRVKIGRQEISLKQTSPRNMATAGRLSGLIIQALRYLGREHVDDKTLARLRQKLGDADTRALLKDLAYAPAWIGDILRRLAQPK